MITDSSHAPPLVDEYARRPCIGRWEREVGGASIHRKQATFFRFRALIVHLEIVLWSADRIRPVVLDGAVRVTAGGSASPRFRLNERI